jgi:hypothetical protein
MTAHTIAIDAIFTDPNMAVDATYLARSGGPAVTVRVIRRNPDQGSEFGGAGIVSDSQRIDVRVSEVPAAQVEDRYIIDGEAFIVQSEPMRDRGRFVWQMAVRHEADAL